MSLFDVTPNPRIEGGAVKCDVVIPGGYIPPTVRPCDLPPDHELFDPFDWGDDIKRAVAKEGGEVRGIPTVDSDVMDVWLNAKELSPKEVEKQYKFVKDSNQYKRVIKALGALFPGGYFERVEFFKAAGQGMFIKSDLFGFADVAGVDAHGRSVFAQITTKSQVGAHLRKWTTPNNRGECVEPRLREFLRRGCPVVIFGYYKESPSPLWRFEVTPVTESTLDAVHARKRPRR